MIALASSSPHKAMELARLLGLPVRAISGYVSPDEDGATFHDNAMIKARAGLAQAPSSDWVIADDSGLVVTALAGAPGVHSARFGGEGLDDAGRVRHLLELMRGVDDRAASFVCNLVVLGRDEQQGFADGTLAGTISLRPRGTGGFGYDPVFVPVHQARTVGEMSAEEKDEISHRGRAVRLLRRTMSW